jgi:hypothetical protein
MEIRRLKRLKESNEKWMGKNIILKINLIAVGVT